MRKENEDKQQPQININPNDEKKKKFIDMCKDFFSRSPDSLRNEIISLRAMLNDYERSIVTGYRELLDKEQTLIRRDHSAKTEIETIVKHYELMKKHKALKDFTFEEGYLILSFKPIKMIWKQKNLEFPLPEYKMKIDLHNGQIYFNADMRSGYNRAYFQTMHDNGHELSYFHPHGFENGNACMGNFTTVFKKIVISSEFSQIVDFVYEFITHYNNGDPVISWDGYVEKITGHHYQSDNDYKEGPIADFIKKCDKLYFNDAKTDREKEHEEEEDKKKKGKPKKTIKPLAQEEAILSDGESTAIFY